MPANCPSDSSATVIYGFAFPAGAWAAGSGLPDAHWIWRADAAPTQPADLQVALFEKTFVLGANPSGTIAIGADDFAEVVVNGVVLGSIGSTSNVNAAAAAQNGPTTFNLAPALRAGVNTITVLGQNGPASFAGGCGGNPCTYSQNPAGVVFAGTLLSQ